MRRYLTPDARQRVERQVEVLTYFVEHRTAAHSEVNARLAEFTLQAIPNHYDRTPDEENPTPKKRRKRKESKCSD